MTLHGAFYFFYKSTAYDGRMSYSLHLMEALETMSYRYQTAY